jgi:UDP-N-acetylmuramoylalanine--D-glutamate ligase
MDISQKNIVILGAARSGLAAAELAQHLGANVFVSDKAPKSEKREEIQILKGLGIPFEFGNHSDRVFTADYVILSPGIPQTTAVVRGMGKKGIPVLSEIEFAYRFCKSPIIAVTGSNGKTTTTTLIGEMLKKQMPNAIVAGNIGSPFSKFVSKSSADSWAVVEVSSFQLETIIDFRPKIAIILNLSPNHLDWYKTYEDYVAAKLRIIKNLGPDDLIIYDGDNPGITDLIWQSPARQFRFSTKSTRSEGCLHDEKLYFYNREFIATDDILLKGAHNYKNIMAACIACMRAGIDHAAIKEVLNSFSGVEHRLEHVSTVKGIHFINDSKATTIESLNVAIQSFNQPVLLIAGGKDKGADFSQVNTNLPKYVRHAFLIGAARERMARTWEKVIPFTLCDSLEDAVTAAYKMAKPKEYVLLSPACSSFDMFTDFEDRGRKFKEIVKTL